MRTWYWGQRKKGEWEVCYSDDKKLFIFPGGFGYYEWQLWLLKEIPYPDEKS